MWYFVFSCRRSHKGSLGQRLALYYCAMYFVIHCKSMTHTTIIIIYLKINKGRLLLDLLVKCFEICRKLQLIWAKHWSIWELKLIMKQIVFFNKTLKTEVLWLRGKNTGGYMANECTSLHIWEVSINMVCRPIINVHP